MPYVGQRGCLMTMTFEPSSRSTSLVRSCGQGAVRHDREGGVLRPAGRPRGAELRDPAAGARAIGPVLQGFAKPLSDLSRGASVADVVAAARVLVGQGPRRPQPRSPIGT
jgi:hypothetical protein